MNDELPLSDPFRVMLIFHHRLDCIQVASLGTTGPGAGGVIRGRTQLLSFLQAIGLDAIIQTTQLSDLPVPSVRRTFHVAPADAIIRAIERRFERGYEALDRILSREPLTAIDNAALQNFDTLRLGATKVGEAEGTARMRAWFKQPTNA